MSWHDKQNKTTTSSKLKRNGSCGSYGYDSVVSCRCRCLPENWRSLSFPVHASASSCLVHPFSHFVLFICHDCSQRRRRGSWKQTVSALFSWADDIANKRWVFLFALHFKQEPTVPIRYAVWWSHQLLFCNSFCSVCLVYRVSWKVPPFFFFFHFFLRSLFCCFVVGRVGQRARRKLIMDNGFWGEVRWAVEFSLGSRR